MSKANVVYKGCKMYKLMASYRFKEHLLLYDHAPWCLHCIWCEHISQLSAHMFEHPLRLISDHELFYRKNNKSYILDERKKKKMKYCR